MGFGLMFGDGNPFIGHDRLCCCSGADNSPAMADAYQGVYSVARTGPACRWREVLLPAGLRRNGGHDRLGRRGRAHQVRGLHDFLVHPGRRSSIPIGGHWIWGGGWLARQGFLDFAGSTVVHSVGGWAALAGVIVLGPRIGKYLPNGKVKPIPGHNMTSATLGCLILWLGWFGFNPGSTMAADPGAIATIAVTTNTAAAAGCLTATVAGLDGAGQARPQHDHQRHARRAGCDHRRLQRVSRVGSSVIIGVIAGVSSWSTRCCSSTE